MAHLSQQEAQRGSFWSHPLSKIPRTHTLSKIGSSAVGKKSELKFVAWKRGGPPPLRITGGDQKSLHSPSQQPQHLPHGARLLGRLGVQVSSLHVPRREVAAGLADDVDRAGLHSAAGYPWRRRGPRQGSGAVMEVGGGCLGQSWPHEDGKHTASPGRGRR